jgi:hypothetical protein
VSNYRTVSQQCDDAAEQDVLQNFSDIPEDDTFFGAETRRMCIGFNRHKHRFDSRL